MEAVAFVMELNIILFEKSVIICDILIFNLLCTVQSSVLKARIL